MYLLHQSAFLIHVMAGICSLILFWIPLWTRKGALDHRRFGRWFCATMYAVAGTGLLMAVSDLLWPLAMHPVADPANAVAQTDAIRDRAVFLLSLSILVLATTRQGWLVILEKGQRLRLRSPLHTSLCLALLLSGLGLGAYGLREGEVVYIAFAALQLFLALRFLHYNLKPELQAREWLAAHLAGLIGSGIGAYTAFFVFGGNRIITQFIQTEGPHFQTILWLAPGVIGGVAITLLSRHYTPSRPQRR